MGRAGIVIAVLVLAATAGIAVWLLTWAGPEGLRGGLSSGAEPRDRTAVQPVTVDADRPASGPGSAPPTGAGPGPADVADRRAPDLPARAPTARGSPAVGGTVRDESGVPVAGVCIALVLEEREGAGLTTSYDYVTGPDGSRSESAGSLHMLCSLL